MHYLNCAYMSPVSRFVEQAGIAAVQRKRVPTDIAPHDYFAGPDQLRARFAQLVSVPDPRSVALVSSVSYAMAVATQNVSASRGQNIVVIGDEFPSAVLPWRRLARERSVELRTVSAPTECERGRVWNERIYDAIDTNTATVVLSHVHWSDGTLFDVASLAQRARDVGAVVVVDGTQSLGALPFDVAQVQPDLLVAAGYKWLMGGYGLAIAYFGPRFNNGQPIEEVWTNQLGSDNFAELANYRDAYYPDARRYDVGERANFVLVAMLCTAIEQLLGWGISNIQHYCQILVDPWLDQLHAVGGILEEPSRRASHLFGIRFDTVRDLQALATVLRDRNIHVSVRGNAIRVSPHIYNDHDDMAAFVAALSSHA
jgi:selenocysteine lyase/cysteine desulfurase